MTEVYAALDQLRIAMARANRTIVRCGVPPAALSGVAAHAATSRPVPLLAEQ